MTSILYQPQFKIRNALSSHFLVRGEAYSLGLIFFFAPGKRNWHQLTQNFLELLPIF